MNECVWANCLNVDVVHSITLGDKGRSLANIYENQVHSVLNSSGKCNRSLLCFVNDYRQKERSEQ